MLLLTEEALIHGTMLFETHKKLVLELTNQRLPPYIETEGQPIVQVDHGQLRD